MNDITALMQRLELAAVKGCCHTLLSDDCRALVEALESRTVTVNLPEAYGYLRENDGQIQISIGAVRPSDRSGGYATPWFAIYTVAGIQVIEGEGQ